MLEVIWVEADRVVQQEGNVQRNVLAFCEEEEEEEHTLTMSTAVFLCVFTTKEQ